LPVDKHIVDYNLYEMNDEVDKTISISNLKNIDFQNSLFPNDLFILDKAFTDTEKLCEPINQDCTNSYVEVILNNGKFLIN
jgi:hypothetical protein